MFTWNKVYLEGVYLICSALLSLQQPQPPSYWRPRSHWFGSTILPSASKRLRKILTSTLWLCLSPLNYNSDPKWRLWKELTSKWKLAWSLGPFRMLNRLPRQHSAIISITTTTTVFSFWLISPHPVLWWILLLHSLYQRRKLTALASPKLGLSLHGF